MDKKFWNTIILIVVLSNGLSILILFETLIFKKPFITLFILIFFATYRMNVRIFGKKRNTQKKQVLEMEIS